jgi:GNAT superfamily N-acetyltransferase
MVEEARPQDVQAMPTAPVTPADIRRGTEQDLPAILALARRTIGWLGDDDDAAFFRWKHFDNPFGASPMWIAEIDGRVAGFRTFVRWELVEPTGGIARVVRAVDTATDPDFQGRGIFTALTLHALDELQAEGVDFVFNTPNQQSLPGYLKMGWEVVGRLTARIRPTSLASLPALARARQPAALGAVGTNVGDAVEDAFGDRDSVEALLASTPPTPGIATNRTPQYLAWRYGLRTLRYRVLTGPGGLPEGGVVFHLRRRGPALEAVVCDVLLPADGAAVLPELLQPIATETGADYLIRLDGNGFRWPAGARFVSVPRTGPTLTVRAVGRPAPTALASWNLSMGDVEVF